MSSFDNFSTRIQLRKRVLGAVARALPGPVCFRLLGLPAGEVHGDPEGQIAGYRAEAGARGVLHHVPGGMAWGRGAHLDARYRLIHALSPGINRGFDYWMLKRQRFLPKLTALRSETVSLVADGQDNYYHWLLDVVPRMAALDPGSVPCRHYLVSEKHPFHRETLDLLGIPAGARTAVDARHFYTAPELLVPTVPPGVSRENVACVRQLLLAPSGLAETPAAQERIYISRRYATSRRVLNEAGIEPILKKHHFRICHLEQLSLREQILLFRGAGVILAPHGAAWTNLIFARPGARALEIVPAGLDGADSGSYFLYETLASAVGAPYERMIAQDVAGSDPHTADLRVDPTTLEAVLRRLD